MSNIGIRKYFTSSDDVFYSIYEAMIQAGWTLHDTVTNSDRIYTSQGEEGIYAPIYMRIWSSGGDAYFRQYLYWDEVAHSGSVANYTGGYSLEYDEVPFFANFAGNKDVFGFHTGSGTNSDCMIFGFCNKLFDPAITNTTSSVSAGSNVTVPVLSSVGLRQGQYVQFVGVNGEGRDRVTINSIPDSTSIVITSLPRDYASGAYVGANPCPAFYKDVSSKTVYLLNDHSLVGTQDVPSDSSGYFSDPINYNYANPDYATGLYLLFPMYLFSSKSSSLIGIIDNSVIKRCSAGNENDFLVVNPNNTSEQGAITTYDGVAKTITDTSKNWTTNEWTNMHVCLVDGTGSGSSALILSNTSDTLTLESTDGISETLDSTTVYRIVEKLYRYSSRSDNDNGRFAFIEKSNVLNL